MLVHSKLAAQQVIAPDHAILAPTRHRSASGRLWYTDDAGTSAAWQVNSAVGPATNRNAVRIIETSSMDDHATLVDTDGNPRLVITLTEEQPSTRVYPHIEVSVHGDRPQYELRAEAKLSKHVDKAATLAQLLDNLHGSTTFSIWGYGDYRLEGPLLQCELTGDGLGHFEVAVAISEGNLQLADTFTTDQTCLRAFINMLKRLRKDDSERSDMKNQ